jgi:NAD+ kinase
MPERRFDKIAFVASTAEEAQSALQRLRLRYGDAPLEEADVVVALGGDGLMLQTLHRLMGTSIPIYGMNRGSVGFLLNDFREDALRERLQAAQATFIHPLVMEATDVDGNIHVRRAINEVSMFRQIYQAAKLRIHIDGKLRLAELICDGVLVATPAGSTAYNLSAHGPILPLGSPLLALTPISPFRPRRWRGALLPDRTRVSIEVLESDKRPVSVAADHNEIRSVVRVDVTLDRANSMLMLHDSDHGLEERVIAEQFGS